MDICLRARARVSRTALDEWSRELLLRSILGRGVLLVLKAYVAALAVVSAGALALVAVRIAGTLYTGAPLSTDYLFGNFTISRVIAAVSIWPAVMMAYSLAVSAPVFIAWRTTGLWRKWPWTARITFVLAFLAFDVWLRHFPGLIPLAAAGWVLAVGLFPRESAGAGSDATRNSSDRGLDLVLGATEERAR
jgi:hypothetical protein